MKLSIIIPIYNGSDFLERLIETISNFTYSNFEVVFIDNNSSDGSQEKLNQLLKNVNFSHQLLSEKKQGAGHARNTGIKYAKGDFLAFLDCDDTILPQKFQYDFNILNEHNVDFVFCRALRFYEDGRTIKHPIKKMNLGLNLPPHLGYIWLRNYFTLQGPGSIVVKKSVVEEIGGFYTSMTGEDAYLFIRLGLEYKGYFYDETFYHYFRHKNSTISASNKTDNGSLERYFELRKNLVIDKVIKQHPKAVKILREQLQTDILKLHHRGKSFKSLMKDERLIGLDFSKMLFNPVSLFINRRIPHIKYNPFYQVYMQFLKKK